MLVMLYLLISFSCCHFTFNLVKLISSSSNEVFMLETLLILNSTRLMKVIHVHLPNKRAVVIVFEVFR
jgi:hypothetical protein